MKTIPLLFLLLCGCTPRWEYQSVIINPDSIYYYERSRQTKQDFSTMIERGRYEFGMGAVTSKQLAEAGAEGWEAVSAIVEPSPTPRVIILMKRRK
jgi:hypothetical protein